MMERLVQIRKRNSESPVLGPQLTDRASVMKGRLRYSSRLSIVLTDRCNIACSHCLPECDPKRKERLSWPAVEQIIRQAQARGTISTICFTGGEPFLDVPVLTRGVQLCAELGLESTVMTNAFWAKTQASARAMLERLRGLSRLGLSTDTFHQEFISVEHIENAVRAAHELDIECGVRVCHLDSPAEELERVRQQLISVAGWYELEHQPVQPLGRAREQVAYERIFAYDTELACCRSADVHSINPQGELTACCGATGSWRGAHPLKFGNVTEEPLSEVLARADQSWVLHALRLWGPAGLFRLAQQQSIAENAPLPAPGIQNICELCSFVVTDPARSALLQRAVRQRHVREEIALGRLMELGETSSFEQLSAEGSR
jgi:MoaA/NifB/PqqE/SkfB family radical SAM enzyme